MPFPYCSESKTSDDDWLKAESTVHLLTLFGWTVPSGVAIKAYGDTSLLGRASIDYFFVVCHLNIFFLLRSVLRTHHYYLDCDSILVGAAFADSIGNNLANFPQGPAIDDKFWLYLITWHIGLFSTMLLGQIGWQGRKQGYFK